jgi:TonB family protein
MRKIIFICFTICFVSVFALAQNQPFKNFDKAVKKEKAGFSGNKENLSTVFNQERIRLGENFETELLKYLGNDVEKHYWIGTFLESESYLHGSKPLPDLALKVWQNAHALIGEKTDEKSLGVKFKISVLSSILAMKVEKYDLAVSFKKDAEQITNSGFNTGIYFPGLSVYERCLYQNVGGDTDVCKEDKDKQRPKETIINAGMLNGKATSLPYAEYPEKAKEKRLSGLVKIKILVDVDGKVISAEGVEGHSEFFESAIKAAKKAKFKPTTLSGEHVKITGVLVYSFVL